MQQQTSLFFYKFRFLLAAIFIIAFLTLISALVTAIGSNTVLAHPPTSTSKLGIDTPSSPYFMTNEVNALAKDAQDAMLSAGGGLYRTCQSITTIATRSGQSITQGSAVVASSLWHGTDFVARGIGSGVWHGVALVARGASSSLIFTLRLPGKVIGSIAHEHAVGTIIRPADNKSVPVISETSAAALAQFSAQQQQEIAQWQAAQLAANRSLDGTVVAGDPNRGGYPTKWADAPQDSALDKWGMYNRECVSYTAWKVFQTYGHMPFWGGVGNANEWPRDAERAGIQTGSAPQVGSVAISTSGYYGHAMWVEKVSGDNIYVSQYNYNLHGDYSEMWVNGSHFTYIYFK